MFRLNQALGVMTDEHRTLVKQLWFLFLFLGLLFVARALLQTDTEADKTLDVQRFSLLQGNHQKPWPLSIRYKFRIVLHSVQEAEKPS